MSRGYTMREFIGISKESFADATKQAVDLCSKEISGHSWFEVDELRGHITEGRVTEYQAKVRVAVPIK